jgi:hypothetical protein
VWSSIFYFNGIDRLAGPRHPHPTAPSRPAPAPQAPVSVPKNPATPAGPFRLLARGGFDLGWLVGVELLAAVLLGGLALATRPWSRAGPVSEPPRLRRAMGAALTCWLVIATVLFTEQQIVHPRYLEGLAPPVAAAVGVGIAALVRLGRRRVPVRVLAAAVLLGACAYEISIAPSFAGPVAAAAIAATVLIVLPAMAFERKLGLRAGAAAVLAAVALLVVPARTSIQLVSGQATDAGQTGAMPRAQVDALSGYLQPRTRGARYELAVDNYSEAAALIIRDARPVMIVSSVAKHQITSASTIRAAFQRGDVRYALMGGSCARARSLTYKHCLPALRWIRAHGVDVTKAAGMQSSGLSLFQLRPGVITRSQHGRRPH